MNVIAIWRRSLRSGALLLGLGAVGSMFASQAEANCAQFTPLEAQPPARWNAPTADALAAAVFRPGTGQFVLVDDDRDVREAGIVGLWRFTFVSDGTSYPHPIPYGVVIDFGTAQWHSDGTEFMISGGRAPSTGDVCMGVWRQTGRNTYKMRHIALGWGSSDSTPPVSPAAYLGPSILRQQVTLNRSGNSFEGTVTIDVYATDETTLIEHVSGKVIATRFTVD